MKGQHDFKRQSLTSDRKARVTLLSLPSLLLLLLRHLFIRQPVQGERLVHPIAVIVGQRSLVPISGLIIRVIHLFILTSDVLRGGSLSGPGPLSTGTVFQAGVHFQGIVPSLFGTVFKELQRSEVSAPSVAFLNGPLKICKCPLTDAEKSTVAIAQEGWVEVLQVRALESLAQEEAG